MKDSIGEIGVGIAFIFVVFLVFIGPYYLWQRFTCMNVSRNTGRPTSYSLITGCYIETKQDGFVPLSHWRSLN